MSLTEIALEGSVSSRDEAPIEALVASSFEDTGLSREQWDNFVLEVGCDIYSSYDWCSTWWRHYGNDRDLRLFVFRQEGRIVGLAPMFIERIRLGPIAIRIAKRLSSDFTLAVFAVPLSARWAKTAYGQIATHLIETEKCDAIWFGFQPSDDPSLTSLRAVANVHGGLVALARDVARGVCTYFHLPDGFEAYVASLGRSTRQNYRRKLSLLKKTFDIREHVASHPSDASAEFRAFRTFHTKQWEAEGKPGHFGDWPHSDNFNQELVRQLAQLGRFRMLHLCAGDNPIAMQYAFTFGSTCYWRLPARSTEKDMDRFSLGVLSLLQLLEQMGREGIRRVEGGPGHYDYKVQYGGCETEYVSLLLKNRIRASSSVRVHLFVMLSDLIHLAYYRIWRLRVSPRLPFRSRPLWRTWIRSRM